MSEVAAVKSPWMDVNEAAAHLKVSVSFIYKRTYCRAIPFHKVGGHVRFLREELDEWVKSRKAEVDQSGLSTFQRIRSELRSLTIESDAKAVLPLRRRQNGNR